MKNSVWKIGTLVVAAAVLLSMSAAGCASAEKEPIIFGDLSWDSAQVNNRIAAFMLAHGYGYDNIEYIREWSEAMCTSTWRSGSRTSRSRTMRCGRRCDRPGQQLR
jgi:ABC-type proline/glycine betaine transport system substrate-binding protein